MVLKRRQDGFVGKGGHGAVVCVCMPLSIACGALMDGSDLTASTPKIVGDVTTSRFADRTR